jgi:hypothetical protein
MIHGLLAVVLYLIILFSIMQSAVLLGIVAIAAFTVRFSAVALIPLAIALDGYYGAFYEVPALSIASVLWYILSEVIRARVNIVQSKYE